jgi:hypothetical protein
MRRQQRWLSLRVTCGCRERFQQCQAQEQREMTALLAALQGLREDYLTQAVVLKALQMSQRQHQAELQLFSQDAFQFHLFKKTLKQNYEHLQLYQLLGISVN